MHLIDAQYRILDTFEKNPFQNLMLGSSNDAPDDIVVINEIFWSPLFTRSVAESIYSCFLNLKTHSEDDTSCQLVTTYHKGTPVAKHLSSRSLPFANRINLCYGFLKDMVSYSPLQPWIQDILIDEDQIVVWDDQLLYNELMVMKTGDAAYAAGVSFFSIQKKVFSILAKLMGSVDNASPALISFMDLLKHDPNNFSSLQSIFDEFQKVYLYDYYLEQNNASSNPMPQPPIPILFSDDADEPSEMESIPETEEIISVEPVSDPEPEAVSENAENSEDEMELPAEDTEEASAVLPILQELDAVDADMEKNLELFFNKNRKASDAVEEEDDDISPDKRVKVLWLIGIALLLALILWASSGLIFSDKNPVASYTGTLDNGVWQLKDTSTFKNDTVYKRSEWILYENGTLVARYDSKDLTIPLEGDGPYQITYRVMDSNGAWSPLIKRTLEKGPEGVPAESGTITDTEAENEQMDRLKVSYSTEGTAKDTVFYRTGSYSVKIEPGKGHNALEVSNLDLNNSGMVSIWLAGESVSPIIMDFVGYKGNTKVFSKTISHTPITPNQWEMRQFTLEEAQSIDRMILSIKSSTYVFIDDLNIDSFK